MTLSHEWAPLNFHCNKLDDNCRLHNPVYMQAKTVAQESPAFVNALNGMPLVLMSEGGSANIVWKSIELGAVEYLEKPLSELKLRNIWQHVVRKVCPS